MKRRAADLHWLYRAQLRKQATDEIRLHWRHRSSHRHRTFDRGHCGLQIRRAITRLRKLAWETRR